MVNKKNIVSIEKDYNSHGNFVSYKTIYNIDKVCFVPLTDVLVGRAWYFSERAMESDDDSVFLVRHERDSVSTGSQEYNPGSEAIKAEQGRHS